VAANDFEERLGASFPRELDKDPGLLRDLGVKIFTGDWRSLLDPFERRPFAPFGVFAVVGQPLGELSRALVPFAAAIEFPKFVLSLASSALSVSDAALLPAPPNSLFTTDSSSGAAGASALGEPLRGGERAASSFAVADMPEGSIDGNDAASAASTAERSGDAAAYVV
jgi:hypothetical protein